MQVGKSDILEDCLSRCKTDVVAQEEIRWKKEPTTMELKDYMFMKSHSLASMKMHLYM